MTASVIPDKLKEVLEDVGKVYNSKSGMNVYPNSFSKLQTEILKVCNKNVLLEKENAELKKRQAEIIEVFTSASSGDDFEMAESAREIMEILNIPCYRHGKVINKLTTAKEIIRELIDNAPNVYSGRNMEEQQKKCFSFYNAIIKAKQFIKEE